MINFRGRFFLNQNSNILVFGSKIPRLDWMKKICQLGLSLVFLLRRIKEEARLWRPRELPHPPQPLSFYFEEAEVTRSKEPSRNGSILLYIKKNHIKSRENPTLKISKFFSRFSCFFDLLIAHFAKKITS